MKIGKVNLQGIAWHKSFSRSSSKTSSSSSSSSAIVVVIVDDLIIGYIFHLFHRGHRNGNVVSLPYYSIE
jgi:hypothetical protein